MTMLLPSPVRARESEVKKAIRGIEVIDLLIAAHDARVNRIVERDLDAMDRGETLPRKSLHTVNKIEDQIASLESLREELCAVVARADRSW
jgi:hypothetical protein